MTISEKLAKETVIGLPVLTAVLGYLYGLFKPNFSIHSLNPLVYSYGYNTSINLLERAAIWSLFFGAIIGIMVLILISMFCERET